jgi:hypothetical protein
MASKTCSARKLPPFSYYQNGAQPLSLLQSCFPCVRVSWPRHPGVIKLHAVTPVNAVLCHGWFIRMVKSVVPMVLLNLGPGRPCHILREFSTHVFGGCSGLTF